MSMDAFVRHRLLLIQVQMSRRGIALTDERKLKVEQEEQRISQLRGEKERIYSLEYDKLESKEE
jgi:hypothetical protein